MKNTSRTVKVDAIEWPVVFPVLRLLPAGIEALRPGRLLAGLLWVFLVFIGAGALDLTDSNRPLLTFLQDESASLKQLVVSVSHMDWIQGALTAVTDLMVKKPGALIAGHPWHALPGLVWLLASSLFCGAIISRASALQISGQRGKYLDIVRIALARLPHLLMMPGLGFALLLAIWAVLAMFGWIFFSEHWSSALFVMLVGLATAVAAFLFTPKANLPARSLAVGIPALVALVGATALCRFESTEGLQAFGVNILKFTGAVAFGPFFLLGLAGMVMVVAWLVAAPLLIPAAMVDGADGWDAPARSIAYGVFRFGPWVRMLIMLVLIVGLSVTLAAAFEAGAVQLTGTMVGSGGAKFHEHWQANTMHDADGPISWILVCWKSTLDALVLAYAFSCVATGCTRAYFILRDTCDGVPENEAWPQDEAIHGWQRRVVGANALAAAPSGLDNSPPASSTQQAKPSSEPHRADRAAASPDDDAFPELKGKPTVPFPSAKQPPSAS